MTEDSKLSELAIHGTWGADPGITLEVLFKSEAQYHVGYGTCIS